MHGAIAVCSPRAARDVGKGGRRHRCSSPFTEGSSGQKQACRFIPVSFCFYDALLSQPDRMRNKYHQNTTREAILEVFIVQPHWKMFGHPPGKPILTVLSSPFLNFWALTQTESGLLKFSYLCLRKSPVWVSHRGQLRAGVQWRARGTLMGFAGALGDSSVPPVVPTSSFPCLG